MLEAPASQPVLDGAFSDHRAPYQARPTLVVVTSPAQTDEVPIVQRVGERRTFELPASIWQIMTACYAVFLIALLASTGGGRAGFAIAVSAIYIAMFFGTAQMITRQGPQQEPAPVRNPRTHLQTAFGPMSRGAVFGQILIVPLAVAVFGISIAIIIIGVA
ncbi:MAG: hypothetical protein ACXIUO_09065 [Erythrobacter sp.]